MCRVLILSAAVVTWPRVHSRIRRTCKGAMVPPAVPAVLCLRAASVPQTAATSRTAQDRASGLPYKLLTGITDPQRMKLLWTCGAPSAPRSFIGFVAHDG
jgi:hypothetical protein